MVQRDFSQNYHCSQLASLYSTSNTIKIKLIFSKTKFDHNSYICPRWALLIIINNNNNNNNHTVWCSLLSLCSYLVDFVQKQLKILSSIDNC